MPADCITGEDSSDDELTHQQRGPKCLKELQARLEKQDSYGLDSPSFQAIFRAESGGKDESISIFSDIEVNKDQVLFDLGENPSESRRRREEPRKVKKKKTKSKGSKKADVDESRPESDRATFERLQKAKVFLRKQNIRHPVGKEFCAQINKMAQTRKGGGTQIASNPSGKANKESDRPAERGGSAENVAANGQIILQLQVNASAR